MRRAAIGWVVVGLVLAGLPLASAASDAFTPLTLSASGFPSMGPFPLNVSFVANASGGWPPYSYSWDFGDGTANASGASVAHTYRWTAAFVAHVSVADSVGEVTTLGVNVTTTPPPLSIVLSAHPSTVGVGNVTYLETSLAGGMAPFVYGWSGLPGGCRALPVENLSCAPTQGGTFTVRVVVTDALGHSANSSALLLVVGGSQGPGPATPANTDVSPVLWGAIGLGAVLSVAVLAWAWRRRRL